MKYETKLLLWAALVALAISLTVAWGCGCTFSFMRLKERFADAADAADAEDEHEEDAEPAPKPMPKKSKLAPKKPLPSLKSPVSADLSKKEQELFEDLKNNKLSEKEVMNLVKTGILNEALVEKFLAKLDATAEDLAAEDAQMRTESKTGSGSKTAAHDDEVIEGFSSDGYGYAKF